MSTLSRSLTGLDLLAPGLLVVLLLLPAALWWCSRRGAAAVRFAPAGFLSDPPLPRTWRTSLVWLPRSLQVAGLALLVVALARPAERTPLPVEHQGVDVVLCMDVSSSMSATDMDARRSRLDVALDAAARFVAGRPHDRVGLVAFARYPDLRCPPTLDHDAMRRFLAQVTTVESDSPEDATGIGTAVARAAEVLRGSRTPSRVVVLLTDGEENVATEGRPGEIAPVHAGQLCETLGVRVYTVAVDADGVDTTEVQRLAERTGGAFFTARDAESVDAVFARVDELETAPLAEPRHHVEERFVRFLAAGLGLLLLGRLLGSTLLEALP